MDGGGMDKIYEVWSGHVRASKNGTTDCLSTQSIEPAIADLPQRTLDAMAHDHAPENLVDCP